MRKQTGVTTAEIYDPISVRAASSFVFILGQKLVTVDASVLYDCARQIQVLWYEGCIVKRRWLPAFCDETYKQFRAKTKTVYDYCNIKTRLLKSYKGTLNIYQVSTQGRPARTEKLLSCIQLDPLFLVL